MVLVERADILQALSDHLDRAASGSGRLIFLRGEAGVGKTAVVKHFAADSARRGGLAVRVLFGGCDALSVPAPLGPLVDIAPHLAPTVRAAVEEATRGAAGALMVFQALLAEVSTTTRTTVLVFEDVHWADDATLDLLRFLGRRIADCPVLVIATYRDDSLGEGHPLAVALGDLAACPAVHRHEIAPLSVDGVAALSEGQQIDVAELHRVTGGNPFFVTEVLAAGDEGIPASVREAVLGRIARISCEARAVVAAVAVIGSPASFELVRSVVPHGRIEECLSCGVLINEGGALAFRHDLARQAVLSSVPDYRKAELHACVLAHLRSVTVGADNYAVLAEHAAAANDADAVLEFAPKAATHAVALGAHQQAVKHYASALRYAHRLNDDERTALLAGHAYECFVTGNLAAAIRSRETRAEINRARGHRQGEGEDLWWLSYLAWLNGSNNEARQLGEAALEVLESEPPSPALACAYLNLSRNAAFDLDLSRAAGWAQRARALAQYSGDDAVVIQADYYALVAQMLCTNTGWEELAQLRERADAAGLLVHSAEIWTFTVWAACLHRHMDRAVRELTKLTTFCLDNELLSILTFVRGVEALALTHSAEWRRALDMAHQAIDRPAPRVCQILPYAVAGLVNARCGHEDVWAYLDHALTLCDPSDPARFSPVWQARAEAAWLAGDNERAAREARAGLDAVGHRHDPWLSGALAVWIFRAGGTPPDVAVAQPFSLEISGRWAAAARCWETLGCPYDAALALLSGDANAVSKSLAHLAALGARPAAARARAQLRSMGVRPSIKVPRASTYADRHGLTRREREVLTLLRKGLSSSEIAAKLYISPKTADHHIESILAKLGVHSRAEAANIADA